MRKSQKILPDSDLGAVVIHRWRKRLKDEADFAKACADAAERCRRICEQENLTTVRGTGGTGDNEWYTPQRYVEAARRVMGGIDLDPAKCCPKRLKNEAVSLNSP